jgi:hypothetical protein
MDSTPHIALLGDSILDNGAYVAAQPPLIEQLRTLLADRGRATLLAHDGDVTGDVLRQMLYIPEDATHLVVSVGGSDALQGSDIVYERVKTISDALDRLHRLRQGFRDRYSNMLSALTSGGRSTIVCTIYAAVPGLAPALQTALCLFNDTIVREALARRLPVIDLRALCTDQADYSSLSPIEPSAIGAMKIAKAIQEHVLSSGEQPWPQSLPAS